VDTNVIVAALRASFALLQNIGQSWRPLISVPLILEYDAIAKREAGRLRIPVSTVEAIVNAFCFHGQETAVHFRLRPSLPDPADDFLLELAVAARFGIPVLTPGEFLRTIVSKDPQ
jgi:predicted nucleic acid-binding protein